MLDLDKIMATIGLWDKIFHAGFRPVRNRKGDTCSVLRELYRFKMGKKGSRQFVGRALVRLGGLKPARQRNRKVISNRILSHGDDCDRLGAGV